MAVTRRLRFEVLRRDDYACRYCGAKAPDATLTIDHVVPVALGGGDEPNNLVTACQPCNAGKSSISPDAPLVEDVDATAMLFARAMERVTAQRYEQFRVNDELVAEFDRVWLTWHRNYYDNRPHDWPDSVVRFAAAGITLREFDHFAQVAARARTTQPWRYFCGCVWKELGVRQELARRLIEDGEV